MAAAKNQLVKIKIKHTGKYPLPAYQTDGSAAMDLHSETGKDVHIVQGMSELIPTGIYLSLPKDYVARIYARSSMAAERGLAPSNCVGIVDSDYRGQVFVSLYNSGQVTQYIKSGERIAQLMIEKVTRVSWDLVEELDETDRGIGGFGSTDRKAP